MSTDRLLWELRTDIWAVAMVMLFANEKWIAGGVVTLICALGMGCLHLQRKRERQ